MQQHPRRFVHAGRVAQPGLSGFWKCPCLARQAFKQPCLVLMTCLLLPLLHGDTSYLKATLLLNMCGRCTYSWTNYHGPTLKADTQKSASQGRPTNTTL
ncbi:hypothetical protein EJ05DRAFT_101859 [Pseudovirgaria hyperparasitica]|uniref:Uncharacterized protein n=1 Tax=Pseudovirgaria hyperparasitica TaxID=470096 RepID=A0A6A6W0J2_9PEZI|nr:uncharacterized protein EJ05DRAFT_101859 [Pseudovirgaria hyperparasitica]KAF2755450.1 hypothetical protein EJ05DRAFT_101859 [Pseudovirgaria hyperparasitica]